MSSFEYAAMSAAAVGEHREPLEDLHPTPGDIEPAARPAAEISARALLHPAVPSRDGQQPLAPGSSHRTGDQRPDPSEPRKG